MHLLRAKNWRLLRWKYYRFHYNIQEHLRLIGIVWNITKMSVYMFNVPKNGTEILVLGDISKKNINLLNSTGHVMHQQFNIQQLYVLPTLYLCVLYLSENKQRLVPITA